MPAPRKVTKDDIQRLGSATDADARKYAAQISSRRVQEDTLQGYTNDFRQLEELAVSRRGKGAEVTVEDFVLYARQYVENGGSPSAMRGYKAAFAFMARMDPPQPLSDEEHRFLDDFLDGLCYDAGNATSIPKGAITFGKLQAVIAQVPKTQTHLAHGIMLGWLGMLRTSEIARLEVRDVDLQSRVAIVSITSPKIDRAKKRVYAQHRPCEKARALLEKLVDGKQPTDKVIPDWNEAEVNKIIQRTAVSCKWRTDFKWSGAHCLRHGHAVELEATTDVETQWMKQAGWLSKSSLHHYRKTLAKKRGREEGGD